MTRAIRGIALTTIALVAVTGVGASSLTHHAHDATISNTELFGLAWTFTTIGIVGAAITIFGCIANDKHFGRRSFLSWLMQTAGWITFVLICASATVLGFVNGSGVVSINVGLCVSTMTACLIGYIFGLLVLVGINARDSWLTANEPAGQLYMFPIEEVS